MSLTYGLEVQAVVGSREWRLRKLIQLRTQPGSPTPAVSASELAPRHAADTTCTEHLWHKDALLPFATPPLTALMPHPDGKRLNEDQMYSMVQGMN